MPRRFFLLIAALFCFSSLLPAPAGSALAAGTAGVPGAPGPVPLPAVSSAGAILIDAASGQTLYEKNARQRFFPASTTKTLTAIVALERGRLSDIATVSERAWGTEGTSAYLEPGEQLTLEQLLYGLMLPSGNDAAIAIAEQIAGSVPDFVELMNQKAKALGALDSHFANPHGLHDPEHYASPRDLALIARYGLANPTFARIVSTKEYTLPGRSKPRPFVNHNRLLWSYDGAIGVKTGYTPEANHTLVAAAERGGQRLIAVLMNGEKNGVFADAARLFDFGFAAFSTQEIVSPGAELGRVTVRDGAHADVAAVTAGPFRWMVAAAPAAPAAGGESSPAARHLIRAGEIERRVKLTPQVTAPVAAGTKLGEVELVARGRVLGKVDLVAENAVGPQTIIGASRQWVSSVAAYMQPAPSATAWWVYPLGSYALWRTWVGIRRWRRHRARLRQAAPRPQIPVYRYYYREFGD